MAGRVLFPKTGFTTDDLVRVYEELAPVLIPHLADRPLTVQRFPDDIHGEAFWEKDAPHFTPEWIQRFAVPRKHERSVIHYMSLGSVESLRWAASMGCIEIHPFLHRYPFIASPTLIAFDLDPGPGRTLVDCCAVALDVRRWFEQWDMESFAKVSGSKGMQVYVPLNTPCSYAATQAIARRVTEDLERRTPDRLTSQMARSERTKKIFIDWSQNAEHKTTVSVYSVRARSERPYVSVPLSWCEVEKAASHRTVDELRFTPDQAIDRIQRLGDLFKSAITLKQTLSKALLSDLGIPGISKPRPVQLPVAKELIPTLPRSSGQGGRRLFVVHRRAGRQEIAIEQNGEFQLYELKKLPSRAGESNPATNSATRPLSYLTDENAENGIVWDLGTYELVEGSFEKGGARFYVSGRRMRGILSIVRKGLNWTLKNEGTRFASGAENNRSALANFSATGRSPSHILADPVRPFLPGTEIRLGDLPKAEPRFIKKMDCIAVNELRHIPSTNDWFREIKWDGYRVCVIKREQEVLIRTKSNLSPSARCNHIQKSISASALPSCVLDAELVALDQHERPSFQLLQQSRRNRALVVLYVFDVLNYEGRHLMQLPLENRRCVLDAIATRFPEFVRLSELLPQEVDIGRLVKALDEQRLEGIIVKRKSSSYRPAKSPGTWVKHRLYQIGEFIIGGYLKREDLYFDALIVGEKEDNHLLYREKVRFGFDDEKKASLLRCMESLRIEQCPFVNLPEHKRRGSLTAEQMRDAVWVRPTLHCTVEYTERTESGNIRGHGRFGQLLAPKRSVQIPKNLDRRARAARSH